MSTIFNIDHKVLAGTLLAATSGWALYTSWKLWLKKRKKNQETYEETLNYLHENLMQQYGSSKEILGDWQAFLKDDFLDLRSRCVELCNKHAKNHHVKLFKKFYVNTISINCLFFVESLRC